MGGLFSCCCGDDNSSENGDAGERTRLISENSPQQTSIPEMLQDHTRSLPFSSSLPKGNDEQTALQKILNETAASVIDVSAIDHVPAVEHHDYVEKSALYGKRLAAVGAKLAAKHTQKPAMVDLDASQINRVMEEEPIQQKDMELITEVALRAEKAASEFKIKHVEDLVVDFTVK